FLHHPPPTEIYTLSLHDALPISQLIEKFRQALKDDRQIFVFGNGGSAANASHFATDLGKGSSDKLGKRFRVLSLNDNVSWMTALDRKSTRLNSSHVKISYAVFCL